MKYIVYAILLLSLQSCTGIKSIFEKSEKTKEKEVTSSSEVSNKDVYEEVSKAIKDNLVIPVPTSGDFKCDEKIDEILKRLNTSKSSGGNSYNQKYDEETRQLLIEFIMASTKNKETESSINTDSSSETSFEQEIENNTKKIVRVIPWWLWAIGAWLMRKHIVAIIALFIPGISQIRSLSDLFNPPKKE